MQRLAFLDWARGAAVVVMIVTHCFNAFTRMDLRLERPYRLTMMVGGMASVVFLFLAGVTFAFGMGSADKRVPTARGKLLASLRRAGFVFGFAHLFRGVNWIVDSPFYNWVSLFRVDVLNTMGASMILLVPLALLSPMRRAAAAAAAGVLIACAMPWMAMIDWTWAPVLVRDYFMPRRGGFPLFPNFAYLAFGVAVGALYKQVQQDDRWEKAMLATGSAGLVLVMAGEYASTFQPPWFPASDFWANDPVLAFIRTAIVLLLLPLAWLWTRHTGERWSWIQTIGKESLMIYWVHIAIVYGRPMQDYRRTMTLRDAALSTIALTAAMVLLAQARLWWKARRRTARPQASL